LFLQEQIKDIIIISNPALIHHRHTNLADITRELSCFSVTYPFHDKSKSVRRLEDGTIVVYVTPQMS
jgi:hypothetical protein